MADQKHVIIVGAGPGGLASAMLLAASGVRVTIIEKQPFVGGRTSTHGGNGFQFDLGPTFFLYPRVLKEIYAAAGRDLMTEVPMVRLDPQYHLIFEKGGGLRCTPDVQKMVEQIATVAPRDAEHFPRFIDENRGKLAAFRPILESNFDSLADVLKLPLLQLLPHVRPLNSVDRDLKRYFSDQRIRLAFSFQSKYLGMSPFNCPSLFTILAFLEYEHGVWHPMGGCGAVSEAMARVAREMGVEIRLDEPVERVIMQGRRAVGVATSSGEHRADAIVMNADFAAAMKNLIPNGSRRRWTDQKLAKKKYSCSTFMMYLGLEGTHDELAHHTIWLADDYVENLKDIEQRHVLSKNPSFYVQNPCVTDPSMAPAGHSALYCLAPVTHETNQVDWKKETPRFRELFIKQLEKLGITDVAKRTRYERIITPDEWQHGYDIYKGATFNLAHNLTQMLHLRPHNRFDDVDGIYLAGGGTHPGSGLPVIYESARISSRLLLNDLGLAYHWEGQTGLPALLQENPELAGSLARAGIKQALKGDNASAVKA